MPMNIYEHLALKAAKACVVTGYDVTHYQEGPVVAFKETMRLMEEIDEAIDAHGGWPIE